MNPSSLLKAILLSLAIACGYSSVNGAIVLTIDTDNRTLTWTGTVMSDEITDSLGDYPRIRLGFGNWVGGIMDGGSGLVASSTDINFESYGDTWVVVAPARNSLYSELGYIEFREGMPGESVTSVSIEVTGDGDSFSFMQNQDQVWTLLETLDGAELFFQVADGLQVVNLGAAIGTVSVIPEPSTAVLLLGGLSASMVFVRRKRKASTL